MSRQQKDTAIFFPHDSHASTSDTLTILQSKWGNNGYAAWFKILEKLSQADGHYLDLRNKVKWELFVSFLGIDAITTVEIINLLVEIGNIDCSLWGNKIIWCQSLVNNLEHLYKNRRRKSPEKPLYLVEKGITTVEKGITTVEKGITTAQSKVKKSKVNNNIYNNSLFDLFWDKYPKKKSVADAQKAFKKISPDDQQFQSIMNGLIKAINSKEWSNSDGKYIPYPATWLNRKGWLDEYESGNTSSKTVQGTNYDTAF